MGEKNEAILSYLEDNARFADLMNGAVFGGIQAVDPGKAGKILWNVGKKDVRVSGAFFTGSRVPVCSLGFPGPVRVSGPRRPGSLSGHFSAACGGWKERNKSVTAILHRRVRRGKEHGAVP